MTLTPSTSVGGGSGAMTQLYDNIASGLIASWDVSSISQAYNHLMLVVSGRTDAALTDQPARIRFNNDSGAAYDSQRFVGYGALTQASEELGAVVGARFGWFTGTTASANYPGACDLMIPNYTGTVFDKAFASKGSSTYTTTTQGQQVNIVSGHWRGGTAAINRITILPDAGNFITGSRLTIYGLL